MVICIKGIILAGGKGLRLQPLTLVTHKDLLPVYDKPMICYPLDVLIKAGIKEILIITTKEYLEKYRNLLGDGKDKNITFSYTYEPESKGTAQSIILAKEFIKDDDVCLIYGDNIFLGDLSKAFQQARINLEKRISSTFVYKVRKKETKNFGIVKLDNQNKIISIVEKPQNSKSQYAVTGLYVYTNEVTKFVDQIVPTIRGELEITDVNKLYLERNKLGVIKLNRKIKWIDAGNKDNLLKSSNLAKKYSK